MSEGSKLSASRSANLPLHRPSCLVDRIADHIYLDAQKQAVSLRGLQALHSGRHSM